jgi:5-deoxy-glucuronate isomerase
MSKWHYLKGELATGGWDVHLEATAAPISNWAHTGLRVADLSKQSSFVISADHNERIIFTLAGSGLTVKFKVQGESDWVTKSLRGRRNVFAGATDYLYLPFHTDIEISGDGRFAVGEAPARNHKAVRLVAKEEVPVYIRGAGAATRQIHNFGMPDTLDADRFIVVEGIVPSGNWSGIPAHKHDVYIPGKESNLEEIYYFEAAPAKGNTPQQSDPFGYFRGYTADERPFNISGEVRAGDTVLVPNGWHGPVSATAGYDIYFFNVMAGPDPEREWFVTDDPDHAWIRATWNEATPDPRLPYND